MFCSQCGARVEDGTTVCPGCGARVYRVQLPGGRSVFYFRAAGAEASGDAEAREAMVRERETATDRNSKRAYLV